MATAEALCLLVAVVICRGQEQGVAGDIPWTSAACRGRYSGELDGRGSGRAGRGTAAGSQSSPTGTPTQAGGDIYHELSEHS